MKKVNLCLVLIILFCSFSTMLLSEEVFIDSIENNATDTPANEQEQSFEQNFTDSLWFKIFLTFAGLTVGIFVDRSGIKYKEKRDSIKEARKVFQDLLVKVKCEKLTDNTNIRKILADNRINIDGAFESLVFNVNARKRPKIEAAYKEYKQPQNDKLSDFVENLTIYGFGKREMIEGFGENPPLKTGKDMLIHNLQEIINLTK